MCQGEIRVLYDAPGGDKGFNKMCQEELRKKTTYQRNGGEYKQIKKVRLNNRSEEKINYLTFHTRYVSFVVLGLCPTFAETRRAKDAQ